MKRTKTPVKPKKNQTQKSMRTRKSIGDEQFYTSPDLAFDLVEELDEAIDLTQFSAFVDPAAGPTLANEDDCEDDSDSDDSNDSDDSDNVDDDDEDRGPFLDALDQLLKNHEVIAYDKNATKREINATIQQVDFLTLPDVPERLRKYDPSEVLCLGNPPFGRRGEIAGEFIKKCAKFSDHIAFLLPIGFANMHGRYLNRYVPEDFHVAWKKVVRGAEFETHSHEEDDKEDGRGSSSSREEGSKSRTINVVFLYLQRRDYPRNKGKKGTKVEPNHMWNFLIAPDFPERAAADIRVRGSGAHAGRCYGKGRKGFMVEKERSDDWYVVLNHGFKQYSRRLCKELNHYYKDGKWRFFNTVPNVKYLDKGQLTKVINKIMRTFSE